MYVILAMRLIRALRIKKGGGAGGNKDALDARVCNGGGVAAAILGAAGEFKRPRRGRDTPSRRRRNSAAALRRGERGDELPGFARCRLNGGNEVRLSGRGEAGHALRLLGELRQPPRSHRPRKIGRAHV